MNRSAAQIVLLAILLGCQPKSTPPEELIPDAGSGGLAITGSPGTWNWVDFPDSSCDDGSSTGIGVNFGTSSEVLIFLNGGGACWDATTCLVLNTATHGPFGSSQFQLLAPFLKAGPFDRSSAQNPFRDWSYVFVPYCTGDVHAGDHVVTYSANGISQVYHHVGRMNILAFLKRLVPTFPAPAKLAISGSSAGGFGAVINYDTFRKTWPAGPVYLIDDSGPFFEGDAIAPAIRTAWYSAWNLDEVVGPVCGAACQSDFSQLLRQLLLKYPHDRMSLLSSLQDATIRGFFQLSTTDFQTDLLKMTADIYDPSATARYFLVTGSTHTMLGDPADFVEGNVTLTDWLRLQVTDDPKWSSEKP